jgi:GNAT superfamily N-acetyltransferase
VGPATTPDPARMTQIRAAVPTDIPPLLALIRRYWEFEGIGGFEALRIEQLLMRLIGDCTAGAVWVAESQEGLVGYLVAVLVLSLEHRGWMAEIDEFFVLPGARGGGTGSRLLAAAEAALARRGCVRLQLQLGTGNEAARTFYRRRGYGARAGYELIDKELAPCSP